MRSTARHGLYHQLPPHRKGATPMIADARIIVVEDEQIIAQDICRTLKRLGYTVLATAVTGEEAITQVATLRPDLVLMDIHLQGAMDGTMAADYLRRHFDIPVVYLTAYSDDATLRRVQLSEPFGYLIKPFEERELLVTIETARYRYLVEQKLKRMERWLAATLTSIGDAVIATDPKGQITFINPIAEQLTGWTQAEAVGQDVTNCCVICDEATHLQLEHPVARALREGIVIDLNSQAVLFRRDGSPIPIEQSAAPIRDAQGAITGVVLVVRDVTKQRQAQAAMEAERALLAQQVVEQTAELRVADAAVRRAAQLKDEFLANMSHELRTPLSAILNLAEALQEGIYGPLTPDQNQPIRMVEESGHRLLTLITDILDFAQISAGRLRLVFEPVVVQDVCAANLRRIEPLARKHQLSITQTIDPSIPAIQADPRYFNQIVRNLLSNAVKFTPAGGQIGIEVSRTSQPASLQLCVWDTGIGIAAADQEHLFEPFVQLQGGLNRPYQGAGLGLVVAARLAELHGGRITVESVLGQGSRFTVTLPVQQGHE
ncbi:MAG TPA: ATP-binding protein [Roseiflexaceae bacterium]|nr:ATP-binding protein [Roseiflexaceae bacterium]